MTSKAFFWEEKRGVVAFAEQAFGRGGAVFGVHCAAALCLGTLELAVLCCVALCRAALQCGQGLQLTCTMFS
jgi:hypothetical protein